MYQEDKVLLEFASRTMENIELVKNHGGFEFMQIVNSLLGLIVFPKEQFIEKVPDLSIEEARQRGWPIPQPLGDKEQVSDLREFVEFMRHGVAHHNIEFLPKNGTIAGIKIWNRKPPGGPIIWAAELSESEIETLIDKMLSLIKTFFEGPH